MEMIWSLFAGRGRRAPCISPTLVGALLAFSFSGWDPALAQVSKPQTTGAAGTSAALIVGSLRDLIADAPGAASWTATDEARTLGRLCEPGGDTRVALATTKVDEATRAACKQ